MHPPLNNRRYSVASCNGTLLQYALFTIEGVHRAVSIMYAANRRMGDGSREDRMRDCLMDEHMMLICDVSSTIGQ